MLGGMVGRYGGQTLNRSYVIVEGNVSATL